jgi:hypothetical protein
MTYLMPSAPAVTAEGWPPPESNLDTSAASQYLQARHGVRRSPKTLNKYRCVGGGPKFCRFGRDVFYKPRVLDCWVEELLTDPLTSTSAA